MAVLEDNELMLAVREGQLDQLGVLFERHHAALYRYFVRLSGDRSQSEDLVQEVFFRMLRYRHTFRGDGAFVVWMYHLARNVYVDHHKKWHRERSLEAAVLPRRTDTVPAPLDQLQHDQDLAFLKAALQRLPEDKRDVLILSRYHGLRYKDIAELMGCTVGAIKVRVYRALKELKALYEKLSREEAR